MRIASPLLALALFGVTGLPAAPEGMHSAAVFAQGNAKYQAGDYSGAVSLYRQLVDSGVDSGVVYYNLGNACFKQKKIGPAIYYWEKALARLPRDPDIEANLELANLLVVDRLEIPADPLLIRWLHAATRFFTLEQESWIVLILFLITNALFALFTLARNRGAAIRALVAACTFALLCLAPALSLSWKVYQSVLLKKGIVIPEKVDIRSGPGTQNITVFTIHEGTSLQVHKQVNGWYQVSLPNGWSGWLPADSVWIL